MPFAKSTLQMFRAQLILHDKVREVFESSLRLARQSGYLKKRGMRVALDTTYILGRGAVKDTYNLLADGIANCCVSWRPWRTSTSGNGPKPRATSGTSGPASRARRRLTGRTAKRREAFGGDSGRCGPAAGTGAAGVGGIAGGRGQRQSIVDGAELLGQLLLQDVERKSGDGDADADAADDGVSIRDGVSKDRMLSVHDPELRHGHKSSRRRFNGHKAAIVVDTDSQLITAVEATLPTIWGPWNWWSGAKRVPARWWRKPWATPPMGTAGPARPSPRRDAGWWPKCRAGPTGNTFPKMTFTLTWRRAVAPVRPDRLPAPSCRRESGRMAPVVSTDCRLSSSTGRYVGYVRCAPSASRPKAGRVDGC